MMRAINIIFHGSMISAIAGLLIILFGCDLNISTVSADNIRMCTSLQGGECSVGQTIFNSSDAEIFLSCEIHKAPPETPVSFTWKYLDTESIVIDRVELNTADKGPELTLYSSLLRPNNGWPTGKYAVEIALGGDDATLLLNYFEVR